MQFGAVRATDHRYHRRANTLSARGTHMSLLAEELVEEWLNRQGFFTIRGVKQGVQEMDLLAIRPTARGIVCRQIEVQTSIRPVSYISRVPKEIQRATGRAPANAKARSVKELRQGVREWVHKKYDLPKKQQLRKALAPGPWSRELVVGAVRYEQELRLFEEAGITIHRLADVVAQLAAGGTIIPAASGASLFDLVLLASSAETTHGNTDPSG